MDENIIDFNIAGSNPSPGARMVDKEAPKRNQVKEKCSDSFSSHGPKKLNKNKEWLKTRVH